MFTNAFCKEEERSSIDTATGADVCLGVDDAIFLGSVVDCSLVVATGSVTNGVRETSGITMVGTGEVFVTPPEKVAVKIPKAIAAAMPR